MSEHANGEGTLLSVDSLYRDRVMTFATARDVSFARYVSLCVANKGCEDTSEQRGILNFANHCRRTYLLFIQLVPILCKTCGPWIQMGVTPIIFHDVDARPVFLARRLLPRSFVHFLDSVKRHRDKFKVCNVSGLLTILHICDHSCWYEQKVIGCQLTDPSSVSI